MSIRKWDPFREMAEMRDRIARMFNDFFRETPRVGATEAIEYLPLTDIEETENDIVIKMEIPGLKKEDINIEATENSISVEGTFKEEKEEVKEKTILRERSVRSYKRGFTLPVPVKPQEAKTSLEDGVLTINLPKAEKAKKVKVAIE